MTKSTFYIQLTCTNFPSACFEDRAFVFLAVQKGKETVMDTDGKAKELIFKIPVQVKMDQTAPPNFLGPYVHGKKGDRFLYLVWYNKIGRLKDRFRRAKINLQHLTWQQVQTAIEQPKALQATINLTDKKGHPVCATLKADNITWN